MDEDKWNEIAVKYHEEIVSPFMGEVYNPLYRHIGKIKNKKTKDVAEFGCGLFYLSDFLSEKFGTVHASDFSEKMLELSQKKIKHLTNVTLAKEDLTDLPHRGKFDVIISVNAIIMPSYSDLRKVFTNLFVALKKRGTVMLILPSMESILYHGMLLLNAQLDRNKEHVAYRHAKEIFEHEKYDFFLGFYTDEEGNVQKFYYLHEIEYLLKKAGFKNIKFEKVKYPWGKEISDFEDFPLEEPLWDWFVTAKK